MEYKLKIILDSDVCIGTGEGRGNAVDADICTDSNGVPYIPARRIKGCLRDTADFLNKCGYGAATRENIERLFGNPYGESGLITIDDARLPIADTIAAEVRSIKKGSYMEEMAKPDNVERCFTAVRGQTRLEDGVKVDNSLRFTRVLLRYNPLVSDKESVSFDSMVYIDDDGSELAELLEACCKGTRHIGTNRNRGMGNVHMSLEKIYPRKVTVDTCNVHVDADRIYSVEYRIRLDSSVTIPECGGLNTYIPARSVIGCLGNYCMSEMKGDSFVQLFLDGSVSWSALTPAINGIRSVPAPVFINKLKNGGGRLINVLAQQDDSWKGLKPRTVDGSYATYCESENCFYVSDVETRVRYHNSMARRAQNQNPLYMQDSIDAGYIFGGRVTFCGRYYKHVIELLTGARLRFGRSRNVQYADCRLVSVSEPFLFESHIRKISGKIYAVLNSDMVLNSTGIYELDCVSVRNRIADAIGISEADKGICNEDIVHYGTVGGFQNMWHLQKMHTPIIKAGSMFSFEVRDAELPQWIYIGSCRQEGFGLCRIYSAEEIRGITCVKGAGVDRGIKKADESEKAGFERAYLRLLVRDTVLKYSRDYRNHNKISVGRIRQMLHDAQDYGDFIAKIETIKESDKSSESAGRKNETKELLKEFYGDEGIDWQKLLCGRTGLYEAFVKTPAITEKLVAEFWKTPLEALLKRMHYEKGDRK